MSTSPPEDVSSGRFASWLLRETFGLNQSQIATFVMMILRMYQRGGPVRVAGDERILACYCGVDRGRFLRTIGELVSLGKLSRLGDFITNAKAEAEIARRKAVLAQRRNAAVRGGIAARNLRMGIGEIAGRSIVK